MDGSLPSRALPRTPAEIIEVLAVAGAAQAEYLATKDNDLLMLGGYEGTHIVTAAVFIRLLEQADVGG